LAMKSSTTIVPIVLLAAVGVAAAAVVRPAALKMAEDPAAPCDPTKCLPPNCRCSSTTVPGSLDPKTIPQMVLITYDDGVNVVNYENYYKTLVFNRVNPNGCPAKATFFVSHEYTDYTLVNDLHNRGYELASHSITHRTNFEFWNNKSTEGWQEEIVGMRTMLESFANIPEGNVKGMRAPFLILGGDEQFEVLEKNNFAYDCSWPTRQFQDPGLWPYTLDYASTQDCQIGRCPTKAYPGTWIVPMIDLKDSVGTPCAMLDSCNPGLTADDVFNFLSTNFKLHYEGNRSPFGMFVHSAWLQTPEHFQGYQRFLDSLTSNDDVYYTTISELLEWVKNPTTTADIGNFEPFGCDEEPPSSPCEKTVCRYDTAHTPFAYGERYMNICNMQCPNYYPWYGNVDGSQVPTPWAP